MGYNSKEIKVISTAKHGGNPFADDIINDPMGQWKHPGKITRIPGNDITMKGVDYPVLGVDNKGNSQMMMPGADYKFPGDYVTEYPIDEDFDGDWLDNYRKGGMYKALSRYRTKKNIKSSINYLMARNYDVFGMHGKRFYDPSAKMQHGGWLDKYE